MIIKKIMVGIVSAVITVSALNTSAFAARRTVTATFSDIGMEINGIEYDMHPVIINGTSYFPIRTIAHALSCDVEWISAPKQIIITGRNTPSGTGEFEQASGTAAAIFDNGIRLTADGKDISEAVAIVNNRSYVPLKKVAEALGARATWQVEKRTVQVVNPKTADVDESIKDYYVYDLPDIVSEEDYIVGNWKGYVENKFDNGDYRNKNVEWFISKNSDGTYKIIYRCVVTASNILDQPAGGEFVLELKGKYYKSSHTLTTEFAKPISAKNYKFTGYNPDTLILDKEILYWIDGGLQDGDTNGQLTRF